VYSHNDACSERGRMAERPMTTRAHDDHDDGLVHAHNYACSERGRPAHR
jgi:hypothetical protein